MEINFILKSIGQDPLEYWGNHCGFLKGIYNQESINKMSKAFSEFAEWVVNNPDKQKYAVPSLSTDFNLIFYVVVRSILEVRPETEIVNVEDIYNYIVWYYYHYLDYYLGKKKKGMYIDTEAVFVKDCVKSIIEELNKKENE